jgi:lipopolysaccharide transport system ATP-binding protein
MYYGVKDTIKTFFGITTDGMIIRPSEFLALNHIGFELRRGETLGIIGINGSGKSTLLRLLSGIFPPDSGKIEINGSIGSLIAVGAGFHPHMTGKQNIYLNGTLLGMSKAEIQEKFDEIVEFAEIKDALEAPVATYSSGMKVRLGFSIAIHREPDIMLIDEVLSVGDMGFKNKSLRKVYEYKKKSNGVIFISHDLEQIKMLCDRLIILDRGQILFDGNTYEGIVKYEDRIREERLKKIKASENKNQVLETLDKFQLKESHGDVLEFLDIGILNMDSVSSDSIGVNDHLNYYCDFKLHKKIADLSFSVGILDEMYKPLIWVMNNDGNKEVFRDLAPGQYRLIVQFPEHNLVPGIYYPNIAIRNGETGETYERAWTKSSFHVRADGAQMSRGLIKVNENWMLNPVSLDSDDHSVFEFLKPGDIAIDCGANVGEVTYVMAEKGVKVYAFEPNPFAFEALQKRFKNHTNVVLINKGVWDKPGTLPLYLHKNSDQNPEKYSVSSSLLAHKRNVDQDNYVDVELVDLHEFIVSLGTQVALLKLDVEGAEVEILNSLIDQKSIFNIRKVLVETHEKQIPELFQPTKELKQKIADQGITHVNLNWV